MSIDYLTSELENIANAKRENRQRVANIVCEQKDLFSPLVEITFDVTNKTSIKAAWILEWICTHNDLHLIIPHLDRFASRLKHLTFDSAIRPCAKICEHITTAYYKNDPAFREALNEDHIQQIIEAGFDWLITDQKIAVRAYTMTTLYLFGKDQEWIHPELEHLIRTKIIHESKGCKARGRHILALIEKHRKRKI
ncbi:adenylosuccinate lyase [Flavobacteriaceae bacterium S356]|uniref:Adenylosuccinate lyase n=1 Tax=Asprobacillus argus TaxID=3076534 RepID=A0ABU3LEL0_9FLAO|nr:adenylosuccinate lyase [Flavobacteriaceae bacterium S356]